MDMYSVPGCDALLQLHITPTLKGSTFLCLVCSSVNKLSIENKWGRKAGESKDGKGLIAHVRQHAAGDMHIRCMQSVRYSARQTFKMVAQEVSPWRVISHVTCMHVEQMVRDSTRGVFRCRDTMTWQTMISKHFTGVPSGSTKRLAHRYAMLVQHIQASAPHVQLSKGLCQDDGQVLVNAHTADTTC